MYSYQIFSPRHAALSSSSSSSPSSPSSPPPPPPHADIQYGANKVKWDAQELTATYLSCLSLWFALSFPPLNPSLHSSPLNRMVCQSAVCICPSPPSLSLSRSLSLSICLSVSLLSVFTQTPLPSLPSQHKSHLYLYIYRLEAVALGCTSPSLRFPRSLDRRAAQIETETTPLPRFFTCSAYRIQLI